MNESSREGVRHAYQRLGEKSVAYIDETYRSPGEPGRKFYFVSAVVVPHDTRDEVRDEIRGIVGGDYWHYTEAVQTERGRVTATEMLQFIDEGPEICVIARRTAIDANDRDLEGTRRTILAELFTSLVVGTEDREPVGMIMLERRKQNSQRGADEATRKALVAQGVISRHFRIMQVSPRHENLLWLPDTVCGALRREFVQQRRDHYEAIKSSLEFLTPDRSNPRLP